MGVLKDTFTAVATTLTPEARRNSAQKFTRLLRHMDFESGFLSRAKNWLSEAETEHLSEDIYLETVKAKLADTGFDMTQWGHLRSAVEEAHSLAATGAMQRALEDETANPALRRVANFARDIEKAVAAADAELKPLRNKIEGEQQKAYFMYRPMM